MSSVSSKPVGIAVALAVALALGASLADERRSSAATAPLRVCADPNNLPFSNVRGEGFENRIAELVAGDLKRPLSYFWLPQRRGFVRNSLTAERCDVVMGVLAESGTVKPTRPYYRSSYAFVTRAAEGAAIHSLDDARLRRLRIGIQVIGDDYANPPAAEALASRRIIANVTGYSVYGDYSQPEPQRAIVDAVVERRVDVAIVWGPQAGYFAARAPVELEVVPIADERDRSGVRFAFDIAMGVRRDDQTLAAALNRVIDRRITEIRNVLTAYGVPIR
jgi:mxaJ protein